MLRDNLRRCGLVGRAEVYCSDYRRAVARLLRRGERFDVVFVDPPYPMYRRVPVEELVSMCVPLLSTGGVLVIKHTTPLVAQGLGSMEVVARRFGDTNVSFISATGVDR